MSERLEEEKAAISLPSEEEARYFDSLRRLVHGECSAGQLLREWNPAALDAAAGYRLERNLAFYARSAKRRRLHFVEGIFPGLLAALDKEARGLVESAYQKAHGGRDVDWLGNAAEFRQLIVALVEEGKLHPCWRDHVHHRWALYELGLLPELASLRQRASEAAEGLAINPTLRVQQFEYDPIRTKGEAAGEAQLIAYFVSPHHLKVEWLRLEAPVLAAMRVVDEGIPLAAAAEASACSLAEVREQMVHYAKRGLFVAA